MPPKSLPSPPDPSPKTAKQLLGFANFYRRFIWGYGTMATPLTSSKVPFHWSQAAKEAFQHLKARFTSALPGSQRAVRNGGGCLRCGIQATHPSNIIVKFANDTVVVGLISNGRQTAYLEEVEALSSWCKDNDPDLNVSKTKEMAMDFRREKQRSYHTPLTICETPVELRKSLQHCREPSTLQ